MGSAEQAPIPDWARRERLADFAWLADDLHVLWPAAQHGHNTQGRGAVVIDTTARPDGDGHPFYFMPESTFERLERADALRMVRGYDPRAELAVMLLKAGSSDSTYRI